MFVNYLDTIQSAFAAASGLIDRIDLETIAIDYKAGGDVVTEIDRGINVALAEVLRQPGFGWLSEESVDTPERLNAGRVWIVDPLDGTQEFITGSPEWSVSVGLFENGQIVAGGVWNPAKREMFLGGPGLPLTCNGIAVEMTSTTNLSRTTDVLASRSEMKAGEWKRFESVVQLRAVGSIAYKMALVAAGRADATWTMWPRHEWDVAGGTALVLAAGGTVMTSDGSAPLFNQPKPLLSGILAANGTLAKLLLDLRKKSGTLTE